jgi:hypothetical protein
MPNPNYIYLLRLPNYVRSPWVKVSLCAQFDENAVISTFLTNNPYCYILPSM